MFLRIWQYRVADNQVDQFQRIYGASGEWAVLFAREIGFVSTELLRSVTHPNIWLTIDTWDSEGAWAAFLRAWGDDYAALDQRCQELTVAEGEIGTFLGTAAHLPAGD